jgi:hypothetical protein
MQLEQVNSDSRTGLPPVEPPSQGSLPVPVWATGANPLQIGHCGSARAHRLAGLRGSPGAG